MSKVTVLNRDIDSSLVNRLDPVVYLPKVAAPFTTVVKRAQVVDFANDLLPKFGVDRVMMQAVQEVFGESGPNGEKVFKPINDQYDAVRMVGSSTISVINANGQAPVLQAQNEFIEITFYGNGINILSLNDGNSRSISWSVDGGASSGSISIPSSSSAQPLLNRNYNHNSIISVASGLSLGFHTIKITNSSAVNNLWFYGYEVLNTSSTLQLSPGSSYVGGRRLYSPSLTTASYNSGFESGTLGTRGGRVLVYQKADGTIAKAVTATDAAAAYLSSASHANESEIRRYHWREFGAGRADDFSTLTATSSSRAFTLDDGTTTLVGSNVSIAYGEGLVYTSANDFFTLTFVGTGLDIVNVRNDGATLGVTSIFVDGVSQGNLPADTNIRPKIIKICSGLPYGTHTVKLQYISGSSYGLGQFIVYGPSKPSLPAGAVELADYNLMADFSVASTSTNTSIDNGLISRGVLRKANIREMLYSGAGWSTVTLDVANDGVTGFRTQTAVTTEYLEYVFFGTGVDFRYSLYGNNATSVTVTIDGATNFSIANASPAFGAGWASAAATQVYGGTSFTAATGVLNQNITSGSGAGGLAISGLNLGLHRIRLTYTSGGAAMRMASLDIITPVHSPKINQPGDLQNTLPVGSSAIGDLRKFGSVAVKPLTNWAQAVGVTSGPTTTSTSDVPCPEMSITLRTSGNPVFITFDVLATHSAIGANVDFIIYVNGTSVGTTRRQYMPSTGGYRSTIAMSTIQPLAAGVHKIDVYWSTSTSTATAVGNNRTLTAREL